MKPQDRTRAILRSKVPPSLGYVLIAFADHMNASDETFISPDTVAGELSMARSTVLDSVSRLVALGILVREKADRRSKHSRIDWRALAAYEPASDAMTREERRAANRPRGGLRAADSSEAGRGVRAADGEQSARRTVNSPRGGQNGSAARTRSDQEAIKEAIREAPIPDAHAPDPHHAGERDPEEPECPHPSAPPRSSSSSQPSSPLDRPGPVRGAATPPSPIRETGSPATSAETTDAPPPPPAISAPDRSPRLAEVTYGPRPPLRLPAVAPAARLAQLRAELARHRSTAETLTRYGGDPAPALREAERVTRLIEIAEREAEQAPPPETVAAPETAPASPVAPPEPLPPCPHPTQPPPAVLAATGGHKNRIEETPRTATAPVEVILAPAPTSTPAPRALRLPDTSPVSVVGLDGAMVTLPGDLTALLDYDPAIAGWLVTGGVETSRHLLEYTEAELQMVPRMGVHRARRIARHLRERWNVEPGCLARTHNPRDRVDAAIAAANSFIRQSRRIP